MAFLTVNENIHHSEDYSEKYYTGTVTNNKDPLGLGRVQANVPGLYETNQGEVPWIGPHDRGSPFGYGTSSTGAYGVYGVPPVGATIKVELQGGDEHRPLYSNLQAKSAQNSKFMSPNIWGFQDPSGNSLIVDTVAGSWTFTHTSGDSISFDKNGNRATIIKGNDTETVQGSLNITVQGSATIQVSGNVNMSASGNATYTATLHKFNGPIQASSMISAAGDITDLTGSGNTKTVGNMRQVYDIHTHNGVDSDGDGFVTDPPNQPI